MGVDTLTAWPSESNPTRTIYRDSDWSAAVGASLWHTAPMLPSLISPHEFCHDRDDFGDYSTSNYTATLNSGTVALSTALPNGVAVVTSAAAATETTIQKIVVWNLHATKVLWHETQLNIGDADVGDVFVGLTIADTSPIAGAPTAGIWFIKATGAATANFLTTSASTSTTVSNVATFEDGVNVRVGFTATTTHVACWVNGVVVGTSATNIPSSSIDLRWVVSGKGTAGPAAVVANVDYHSTLQAR